MRPRRSRLRRGSALRCASCQSASQVGITASSATLTERNRPYPCREMELLRGLILSGGAGTRLRPITFTSAKQLVPVANKPILFYGIEALVVSGVRDIGIVVGDTRREIEDAVGDGGQFGARVRYIPQAAPLGLAHAVLISEEFLAGEPFVMYLGDNLLLE